MRLPIYNDEATQPYLGLSNLSAFGETMHAILVKDVMTSPVISVTPETFVIDAADTMEEHNIRRVPVVNEDGQLLGMLTDADVVEAETVEYTGNAYARGNSSEWIRVADVMSYDVITVGIDSTIGELATTLLKHKVGGVPVICSKKHSHEECPQELLGIITETDIFKLIAESWQAEQAESIVHDMAILQPVLA